LPNPDNPGGAVRSQSFTKCGVNQMTLREFEHLIAGSPFRFER